MPMFKVRECPPWVQLIAEAAVMPHVGWGSEG